jgi:CheY-like chemotaxis protein
MKKIMLVDDEEDQIFAVRKALEKPDGGYELIPAESGKKC